MNNIKNYIFDITEDDFVEKVIENSNNKVIVVDFWAPWCGPCKQLTPVLEKVINKCGGKVLLAKINIDENQQIATQLRIQSIPAVLAFKNKQIANAFQGVIPEKKIVEFIETVLGEKVEKDNSVFYSEIKKLVESGNYEEAKQSLEEFLGEYSQDIKAINMYLNCLIELSRFQEVKDFISALSEELSNTNEIKSVIANLAIKENYNKGPTIEEIKIKYKNDPKNLNTIIELSEKYFAHNMIKDSFELLLEQYPKNNQKNKEKIKKVLLKYFNALGNEDESTKYYRKKFSSIVFV